MGSVNNTSREMRAMERLYGPICELTEEEASDWIAPVNPGTELRDLWTEAFGVMNFMNLAIENSSTTFKILAERLVHSVHETLGRTRDGSARLNGATDEHPLKGGLRIGRRNEEGEDEDCDGQCHHYLTMWMYALNRLSLVTDNPKYNDMAIELARAVHRAFVTRLESGGLRIAWKISIDMKTTLVPSKGDLDAITGSIIHRVLQDTATDQKRDEGLLKEELEDYKQLAGRLSNYSPGDDLFKMGLSLWLCHLHSVDPWVGGVRNAVFIHVEDSLRTKSRSPAEERIPWQEFMACIGTWCAQGYMSELEVAMSNALAYWDGYIDNEAGDKISPISHAMFVAARIPGVLRKSHVRRSRPFKWTLAADYQEPDGRDSEDFASRRARMHSRDDKMGWPTKKTKH